jgi:hypothetical protein
MRPGKAVRFAMPRARRLPGRRNAQAGGGEKVIVVFARSARLGPVVRDLTAVIARIVDGEVMAYRMVKAR